MTGYDAIDCRLELAGALLQANPDAALGGAGVANRLAGQLARARIAVNGARAGQRETRNLVRAARMLRTFDRTLTIAAKRGMPPEVATRLRGLVRSGAALASELRSTRRR